MSREMIVSLTLKVRENLVTVTLKRTYFQKLERQITSPRSGKKIFQKKNLRRTLKMKLINRLNLNNKWRELSREFRVKGMKMKGNNECSEEYRRPKRNKRARNKTLASGGQSEVYFHSDAPTTLSDLIIFI